jgi:hypothetical protein
MPKGKSVIRCPATAGDTCFYGSSAKSLCGESGKEVVMQCGPDGTWFSKPYKPTTAGYRKPCKYKPTFATRTAGRRLTTKRPDHSQGPRLTEGRWVTQGRWVNPPHLAAPQTPLRSRARAPETIQFRARTREYPWTRLGGARPVWLWQY